MTARRIAGKVGFGGPDGSLFSPLASVTRRQIELALEPFSGSKRRWRDDERSLLSSYSLVPPAIPPYVVLRLCGPFPP
jgi:hypothetical protein